MTDAQNPNVDENIADEHTQANVDDETPFQSFLHHQRRAFEELGRAVESIISDDFVEHTRNAGKAFVDSMRSLVDSVRDEFAAQNAATDPAEAETHGPSATKIKVEID